MGRKADLPDGQDFACIASRSAMDGTARETRLKIDRDGGLQYVDRIRGNNPDDALVVSMHDIYKVVGTDKERSLVRRAYLEQLALHTKENRDMNKKAELHDAILTRVHGMRKSASIKKQAVAGALLKGIGRYGQLLLGGSGKTMRELKTARRTMTSAGGEYGGLFGRTRFNLAALNGKHSAAAVRSSLADLANGANALNSGNKALVKDLFMSAGNTFAQAKRLARGEKEMQKALVARLGTAGGIGGIMYATGDKSSNEVA